jgi:hypothetical protein
VERRGRSRPAAVRPHRRGRAALCGRADALPTLDDRRAGTRSLLGLSSRRRARRTQHPLTRGCRVRRSGGALRAGRLTARAEQPHDVQLGRRDHGQRLRGGRLRWARIHPPRPSRRICARDPRAVRGRLRRSAVQPHHRPDRDARPDRLAVTGRDRKCVARSARGDPACACSLARAGPDRAHPRGSSVRVLASLPAVDVRRGAL